MAVVMTAVGVVVVLSKTDVLSQAVLDDPLREFAICPFFNGMWLVAFFISLTSKSLSFFARIGDVLFRQLTRSRLGAPDMSLPLFRPPAQARPAGGESGASRRVNFAGYRSIL